MNKSPEMEAFCEDFAQRMFGRSRKDNVCVFCGSTAVNHQDFTDEWSWREFNIGRICEKCQDETFGE